MKRRSAFLTFAACALMAAHTPAKAAAEQKPAPALPGNLQSQDVTDFSKVQTVAVGEGVGFFDAKTGTMYVYDSSLSRCIAIKKLQTLGAPAQTIHT